MGTFIRFPPRGGGSIQPVDGCFLRELPHRFLAFQVSGGTRQKKFIKAQLDFILYTGYRTNILLGIHCTFALAVNYSSVHCLVSSD